VKAIRISHFGPPDVLVYVDEPVPQPKSGEAVVEVHAAILRATSLSGLPSGNASRFLRQPAYTVSSKSL